MMEKDNGFVDYFVAVTKMVRAGTPPFNQPPGWTWNPPVIPTTTAPPPPLQRPQSSSSWAAVALAALLSGCSLIGPQPGLTDIEVTAPDGLQISYESGKEIGSVEGEYTKPDGTRISFQATQIEAFQGQAIAAQVRIAMAEAFAPLAQQMTDILARLAAMYAGGGAPAAPPGPKPPAP